jgi:hypothetical protein
VKLRGAVLAAVLGVSAAIAAVPLGAGAHPVVVTLTTPPGATTNPIVLDYTLSGSCASASFVITGFSNNFVLVTSTLSLAGNALSAGSHTLRYDTNSTLLASTVDGNTGEVGPWNSVTIPDGPSYTATLSCTNSSAQTSSTSVYGIFLRTVTPTPTLLSPTSFGRVCGPFTVSYLEQAQSSGTIQFWFGPPSNPRAVIDTIADNPPPGTVYPATLTTTIDPQSLGLPSGVYTMTVSMSDSLGNPPASSANSSVTIDEACALVSVATDPQGGQPGASSVTAGQSVTYVATVGATVGQPTGTVQFSIAGNLLCGAELAGGQAACSSSAAPLGTNQVTAKYVGDASFLTATGSTTLSVAPALPPPAPGTTASVGGYSATPSGTAGAQTTGITATATGYGSLTVGTYGANPTSTKLSASTGAFFDVRIAGLSTFTSLTLTVCHLNGANAIDWWDGLVWVPFSIQSFNPATGCVTATVTTASSPTLTQLTGTPVGAIDVLSSSSGYDLVGSDGGVFVFAPPLAPGGFFGSLPGLGIVVSNIVGLVSTTDQRGYFLIGSDGGIFAFGDAPYLGSLPGLGIRVTNAVGIVPTRDDRGYFVVGRDGGVFTFGSAPFLGSLPGLGIHRSDVVGIAATPSGNGYWLVAADGTVYAFGGATQLGSPTGVGSPVAAIAGTMDGGGYWVVTQSGAVYAFGDAGYFGSRPGVGVTPTRVVVGIVATSDQAGYWLIGSDGGIFAFGDAGFIGSLPGVGVAVNNIVGAVPTSS